MWKGPDDKPAKPGYYLTYYWNEQQRTHFFKAFSFHKGNWWFHRFEPKPIAWWDKHFDFYVPCQGQEDVDPLPKEYRGKNVGL